MVAKTKIESIHWFSCFFTWNGETPIPRTNVPVIRKSCEENIRENSIKDWTDSAYPRDSVTAFESFLKKCLCEWVFFDGENHFTFCFLRQSQPDSRRGKFDSLHSLIGFSPTIGVETNQEREDDDFIELLFTRNHRIKLLLLFR